MTDKENETKERILAEAGINANELIQAAGNVDKPVAGALVILYIETGEKGEACFGVKSSNGISPILLSLSLLDFVRGRVETLPAYLQKRAHNTLLKYFASGAPEPGFRDSLKSWFK